MKRSLGPSIKNSAVVIFVLGSAGSLYLAYQQSEIYFSRSVDKPGKGLLVFALISIFGVFLSWMVNVYMRGFGELVENVSRLEDEVSSMEKDKEYAKIIAASVIGINEILQSNAVKQENAPSSPSTSEAVAPNTKESNGDNKEENET